MNKLIFFPQEVSPTAPTPVVTRMGKCSRMEALMAGPIMEAELLEIFRALLIDWLD